MKPKRLQRQTGPRFQGKTVTAKDRTTSCVSSCDRARVKPFAGKVFYLDLPSNRTAETLESDIKQLGGTVEKFFSKDIRYLISNKREARYVQCLRLDSPVPSPESGPSSPHLRSKPKLSGSHGDNIQSRSQGQTDTSVTSRGKSLVERVVKEQERVHLNKILSNALEWGVKILYIDDMIAYVHKKKKLAGGPATTSVKTSVKGEQTAKQVSQKSQGGRLHRPFIKIEDSSRHYRPICITMPSMPEFNLKTGPPCSPFCVDGKDPAGTKQWAHRGAKASASDERAHGRKKNRDKKRSGYCECCVIKYENLATHLQSERHKAFSKSDEYSVVDRLVSSLHSSFIHMTSKVKRPKCSVSSLLVSSGPCVQNDLRHVRNMTVAECAGSYSGNASNKRVTGTEGDGIKRCPSYTSLAPEEPCNTRTDGENPPLRTETAPPTGGRLGSFPSVLTQMNPLGHISQIEINSSDSVLRNVDIHNDNSSRSVYVMTNCQEESDMNKDLVQFEPLPDRNELLEKSTENCLSDREEEGLPNQSFSPVRKIRRKASVYKRRRPKVETPVGQVNPNEVPDHSLLKLWELFQSSDDMNVEFHGFED